MGGTKSGGKLAAKTVKERFGEDFYRKIGAMGGKKSKKGGFAWLAINDREKLIELSAKGGSRKKERYE